MDTRSNRVHYYHADASALGGHIRRPFDKAIPVQAPVSLPPVGGYAARRRKAFNVKSIVAFEAAYTQVSGSANRETGASTTLVTATIEKFNVLDTFTADRMVAQISLDHPRKGYIPKVSLIGTQFENVRIGGNPVEIILDLDICRHSNDGEYPNQRCMHDQQFLARVGEQYRRINDPASMLDWIEDRTVPGWVKDRYQWDNSEASLRTRATSYVRSSKKFVESFPGSTITTLSKYPSLARFSWANWLWITAPSNSLWRGWSWEVRPKQYQRCSWQGQWQGRWRLGRLILVLVVISLVACGPSHDPQSEFERVRQLFLRGDLIRAQTAAEKGYSGIIRGPIYNGLGNSAF